MAKRTLPTVNEAEGNGDDRTPTRRTMLNALAVLPAAASAPIGFAAGAGATSPATLALPLRELHRQWAQLAAARDALAIEIDEATRPREPAGDERAQQSARPGAVPGLRAELERTETQIDKVIGRMLRIPIATVEDVAVVLDLAMDYEIPVTADVEIAAHLVRSLMRLAPGFEFTSPRRDLPPDQLAALLDTPPVT
jgi:hypothetical protein